MKNDSQSEDHFGEEIVQKRPAKPPRKKRRGAIKVKVEGPKHVKGMVTINVILKPTREVIERMGHIYIEMRKLIEPSSIVVPGGISTLMLGNQQQEIKYLLS